MECRVLRRRRRGAGVERRECRALEQAWTSGKPELLIAAGRRRSGKSYLLTHVLAERRGFYYQATKGSVEINSPG